MKITIEQDNNMYVVESDDTSDLLDFVEKMLGVSKKPYMYPPIDPYIPTIPYPSIHKTSTPFVCKPFTTTTKTFPLEVKTSNINGVNAIWVVDLENGTQYRIE